MDPIGIPMQHPDQVDPDVPQSPPSPCEPLHPRPPTRAIPPLHPSYLTAKTEALKGCCRAASLFKNTFGLRYLDKPVLFRSLNENAGLTQLPEDVRQLYHDIYPATNYQTGIYPADIRTKIEALYTGHPPPPDRVFRKPEEDNDKDEITQDEERLFDHLPLSALFTGVAEGASFQARIAHAEFYKVCSIKDHARECSNLRRAEATWNAKVHKPLLELALSKRHTSVICENATSARILPCFLPCFITGDAAEGKTVNFVLAPNLGPESGLDFTTQNKLVELAKQRKSSGPVSAPLSVNQTDYPPLMRSPTAVTMVTKVAWASQEEGHMQLGIWTAAWHRRMETLGVGGGKLGPQLPTLPLILTHDHGWYLYFAVDRLDKIEVLGPMHIGTTDNIPDIYQLLTVVGFLGGLDRYHLSLLGHQCLWSLDMIEHYLKFKFPSLPQASTLVSHTATNSLNGSSSPGLALVHRALGKVARTALPLRVYLIAASRALSRRNGSHAAYILPSRPLTCRL